jgi:hypothetical protein
MYCACVSRRSPADAAVGGCLPPMATGSTKTISWSGKRSISKKRIDRLLTTLVHLLMAVFIARSVNGRFTSEADESAWLYQPEACCLKPRQLPTM